jgi:hypothetical protein
MEKESRDLIFESRTFFLAQLLLKMRNPMQQRALETAENERVGEVPSAMNWTELMMTMFELMVSDQM